MIKAHVKSIFLRCFFFVCISDCSYANIPISATVIEQLQTIPLKEQEILKDFFRNLYVGGDFAYTLFGEKPIALIDRWTQLQFLQSDPKLRIQTIVTLRGWKTWEKYRHLFPLECFYFDSRRDSTQFSIALVSKKECERLIKENSEFFQKASGSNELKVDQIIPQLIWGPNSIERRDFSENYFQCLGILLGYGKNNAQAFEKRRFYQDLLALAPLNLKVLTSDAKLIRSIFLNINNVQLPNRIHSISAKDVLLKLQELEKNYAYTEASHKDSSLFPLRTPGFMAIRDSEETNSIKSNFDSIRELLVKIYYSDQFLEIILTQLTTPKL